MPRWATGPFDSVWARLLCLLGMSVCAGAVVSLPSCAQVSFDEYCNVVTRLCDLKTLGCSLPLAEVGYCRAR